MEILPLARGNNIVVQELGKEVLIYDLNTHKALNLNETSSLVYLACDGKTTFDELKRKHKLTDEIIFLALDGLHRENLIKGNHSFLSSFNGLSRREAIRKVGLASIIALPMISSLIAPASTMAASGGPPPNCTKTTCAAQNKNCGTIGDNCGGTINCGICPNGQTCGGGGVSNVCGANCPAKTCQDLGAECGINGDGCGGTINCGICPNGKTCDNRTPGKCV